MTPKHKALIGQLMQDVPKEYTGTKRQITKGKNKGMWQVFDMKKFPLKIVKKAGEHA